MRRMESLTRGNRMKTKTQAFVAAALLVTLPAWGFFNRVTPDACERPVAKATPACAVTVIWDPQHPEAASWTATTVECTPSESDAMLVAAKEIYATRR